MYFPQTTSVPGISIASLLGTVGGNLGMFTGMSVMTIVEWAEVCVCVHVQKCLYTV